MADHRRDVSQPERTHKRERIAREVEQPVGGEVGLEAAVPTGGAAVAVCCTAWSTAATAWWSSNTTST
jgi:hypothetical protein